MGLIKKQPVEFNLWDGQIKPLDWYFGEAGKAAFLSAFENIGEMNEAIRDSNWISMIFNVCYHSRKKPIAEKKNWLIKFFYEYMISRYSIKMATNEHTLILLSLMAGNYPELLPYPDCLDDKKHPLLYFFGQVKDLLPGGYSEQTYPVLKDIAHYIYNVFSSLNKDVSREDWIYDKFFYVDYSEKPKKYSVVLENLVDTVQFPECLYK